MANRIPIKNTFILKPVEQVSTQLKDSYSQQIKDGETVTPLKVVIAATHAGKVTRNKGFYLPSKMKAGAPSFTAQYAKPIQIHHNDKADPIGRVVSSRYVDISSGVATISDSFKDNDIFDKFIAGEMSFLDQVSYVAKNILDTRFVDDPSYEGLGYIELVAEITDSEAILKILDKRYLTGSVGASTDAIMCSVCKKDWAKDGKCKHTPGKVYDGTTCVMVAGDLDYNEWSVVNAPADTHSAILGILNDSAITTEDSFSISFITDAVDLTMEENAMTFKKAMSLLKEKFQDATLDPNLIKKIVDENKDLSEETLYSLFDATLPKEEVSTQEVATETETTEVTQVADSSEELVATPVIDEATLTILVDRLYTLLSERFGVEKSEVEDVVSDPVTEVENNTISDDETAKLLDKVNRLEKEVRYLTEDISNLEMSLADALEEAKNAKIAHISDLFKISSTEQKTELKDTDFGTFDVQKLTDTITTLSASVDIEKIADMLTSGMTRKPEGTVEDPTLAVEPVIKDTDTTKIPSELKIAYWEIKKLHGEKVADNFLKDWTDRLNASASQQ